MDAKKALYRAKLKAAQKRIDSPLVRYNEYDQPVCRVCDVILKSESSWQAHQISAKHREAINNVKAKAAAATQIKTVRTDSSALPKVEQIVHPNGMQPAPPAVRSSSMLPADFFDKKPDTKRRKNGIDDDKPGGPDPKKNLMISSVETKMTGLFDVNIEKATESSARAVEIRSGGLETKQAKGSLPEGFFDDKDADLRARGITPVKLDIKDEYKEFEKLIQEDLKVVDNRLEEDEYDAAEMIDEAETAEQRAYRERVEMLKNKRMELKAARSTKTSEVPRVVAKEASSDDSSSDDDSDETSMADWRAKHL